MNLKKRIVQFVLQRRRNKFKSAEIANKDVTILSNTCIGGCMYNDLGLQFLTPTINVGFNGRGFIDLVNHLSEYADASLTLSDKVYRGTSEVFPIGLLHKDGLPDVEIILAHSHSFEEKKEKWFERYQRINYDKIFLVIDATHEWKAYINEYAELPYPKIIFTDLPSNPQKSMLHINALDKYEKARDSLANIVNVFGKRGYDEFNFVDEIFNRDYSNS